MTALQDFVQYVVMQICQGESLVETLTQWVDIAQIITPLVAVAGFFFLWRQIKVANEQSQLNRQALELSQNNLMPRLFLDGTYKSIKLSTDDGMVTETQTGMLLTIENVGPGMASCVLLTMRDDLSTKPAYDPVVFTESGELDNLSFDQRTRITDYVIGAGKTVSFLLPLSGQYSLSKEHETLSSLSLYYRDVYGRTFKSHILYVWHYMSQGWHVQVIAREYGEIEATPINPYSSTDIRVYSYVEGGKPVKNRPQLQILHLDHIRKELMGFTLKGSKISNDQPITLMSYDFEFSGRPRYRLKVRNSDEFTIYPEERDNQLTVKLQTEDKENEIEPKSLGLRATVELSHQLLELYNDVTKQILTSAKTPIQLEYSDFFIL